MTVTLFDDIVTDAKAGLTLDQSAAKHKCSKRTIMRICDANRCKYKDFKPPRKHIQLKASSAIATHSTPPTRNDPPVTQGGERVDPLSQLPKTIQTLLALGPQLHDVPNWLGPMIVEQIKAIGQNTIPLWRRPIILHPIQHEVMDQILYHPEKKIIMIDGSKRTGKSDTVFCAFIEAQFNNDGMKRWFLYGATYENAIEILRGVIEDPKFYQSTSPLFAGMSKTQLTTYNQGWMKVKASGSERATSGTDCDVIWIDESHSVLIENPKTFAMAAMVLLAQTNIKFIFSMNREGQAYEYFRDEMLASIPPEQIAYFSFTRENCPHISEESDTLVRTIVKASAGEDYAAQYLDNQYVRQGNLYYPPAKIQLAFKKHENPPLELYDVIACGIDWGDNHDTAMTVLGFQGTEAWEEETVYLSHPTSNEINKHMVRLMREYPGIIFVWETSPLGSYVRNDLVELYPNAVFIDSNFTDYKQNYIDNLYIWLVDEELHLKDPKLKRQLLRYCADKKEDDGHDALCHVMYKAVAPRTRMKVTMHAVTREQDSEEDEYDE